MFLSKSKYLYNYGEKIGKSHELKNIPCQDKSFCRGKKGITVAVVSDGCGSSPISQYGSNLTVEAISFLLTEKFDYIYNSDFTKIENQINIRKLIIDKIIERQTKFLKQNPQKFENYLAENQEKYNRYIQKNNDKLFLLESMYATVIFFAAKKDKYIMGQIGDGVLGLIVDNKLKIVLEEKKNENINGTFYPFNIYKMANDKNQLEWYLHSSFQLKKLRHKKISGAILSTDGADAFFYKQDGFHKRYSGVNPIIQDLKKINNYSERQKVFNEKHLSRITEMSSSSDDCAVAIVFKKSTNIREYLVKEYPMPEKEIVFDINLYNNEIYNKISYIIKDNFIKKNYCNAKFCSVRSLNFEIGN